MSLHLILSIEHFCNKKKKKGKKGENITIVKENIIIFIRYNLKMID